MGFDAGEGFTEQHSSSRCKVARVTSPQAPCRGSDAGTKEAGASKRLCFQEDPPEHWALELHPLPGPPWGAGPRESPQKLGATQAGPALREGAPRGLHGHSRPPQGPLLPGRPRQGLHSQPDPKAEFRELCPALPLRPWGQGRQGPHTGSGPPSSLGKVRPVEGAGRGCVRAPMPGAALAVAPPAPWRPAGCHHPGAARQAALTCKKKKLN